MALPPSSRADSLFGLGNQAFDKGQYADAAHHYEAYTRLMPRDATGWINLGLSWMNCRDWQRARVALKKAVALAPERPKPAAMLATVLKQAGAESVELIAALRRATALDPKAVELHLDLGRALIGAERYREAKSALRRVLELDPHNTTAAWLDFQRPDDIVAPDRAAGDAYLARWRAGIARFLGIDWNDSRYAAQANSTIASTTDFHLAYLGLPLVEEQRQNAAVLRRLVLAASPGLVDVAPRPIAGGRRKVAVFSPSLIGHSVGTIWAGSLLALDPGEWELGVFHPGDVAEVGTARWRARVSRFDSGQRPADAWIAAVRDFAPDILIFPDVGMHQLVQILASIRLAPVQVAAWGHPVTTGMATIDYFLSADACEPADADAHYGEKLVRLPRLGVCLEPPEPVSPRAAPRAGEAIRFVCVQSADKLHPGHDALFADVLKAVPGARLDILCNKPPHVAQALAARLRSAFAAVGVDFSKRGHVHARLSAAEYRKFLERAHVSLDSLDFSGGITSLDALWHELPIVTLPGALMRGRQTCGMLALLGLNELIARDPDDYVRIATRLAQDAAWRASIVERIAQQKMTLYRDQSAVAALADFLRTVEPSSDAPSAASARIAADGMPGDGGPRFSPERTIFDVALDDARTLGEAGDWLAAGRRMAAALRVEQNPRAAQGLLECGLQLAGRGQYAPAEEIPAPAPGRLSFVVCSITPAKLQRLRGDLERHLQDEDWELIHIDDARSLAEGYMRGLQRARGDLLVFCHDDIGILCDRFAARLRGHLARYDLIGVAGTDRLIGAGWAWAGAPHVASWVAHRQADGGLLCGLCGSSATTLEGAQALDGVFLAGRRELFETLRFDADTFDGFHLYDIDLSWRAHLAGYRCAVALDLLIWHESAGTFDADWKHYARRFVEKFPLLTTVEPPPFQGGAMRLARHDLAAPIHAWIAYWLAQAAAEPATGKTRAANPRFSIVVPHYDGSISDKFLLRGLDSLAQQTFRDFEVLLYHDGPLSRPLPDLHGLDLPQLHLTITPQRHNDWGHSLRDLGIRAARGDYIVHFNPDNLLYPQALEMLDRASHRPILPMPQPEMLENPQVLVFSILMRGVYYNGVTMWRSHNPEHTTLLSGAPAQLYMIDCMQLVATRAIWQEIGGWYDKSETSDGLIYAKLVRQYKARYVPMLLGEHW